MGTVGDSLTTLGTDLTKFVTVPVTGLGVATLKTATDFVKLKESSMGVFKQMLGGADAADAMYESLLAIAKASTYSQEAFLTAGKTLVGMGTDANNTAKYLQAITDAVAGFGGSSADIESLATVFGKVQAKGKLLTDDLNMLAERGVNGLQILAAHYKVTTEEMQDMVSDGMVPATEGLDILCDGMENGYTYAGQFHQGLSGMAQSLKNGTLTGALDSLKSSFRNMSVEMWDAFENKDEMISAVNSIGAAMGKLPTIMGPITSAIGPMLQEFAEKLNNIITLAEEHPKLFENIVSAILKLAIAAPVIATLGKGLKGVSSTIEILTKKQMLFGKEFSIGSLILKSFSKIGSTMFNVLKGGVTILKLVASGVKALTAIMLANPISIVIAAIVAVIAILVTLYNKCEGFRNLVNNVVGAVVGFLENLWSTISAIFNNIVTFISGIIQNIWGFVSPFFDFIKNCIILYVALVTTVLEAIYNVVATIINAILSFFGTIAGWIYNNVLLPISIFFTSIFTSIYNGIVNFINGFISVFSTVANWIYNNVLSPIFKFFSSVFSSIYGVILTVVTKIKFAFNQIVGVVKSTFQNVKNFISNIFSTIAGIIKAPINGVISAINTVLKSMNKIKVPDWVPGLGGKGVNFKMIPKLSTGTNYVAQEGLAYLHQGEAVVPKKYNPAIGGYGNSNQIVYVTVNADMDVNKFGKAFVRDVKTFSGGAKNSYNYGGGA